jgi:hypothetical protein
MNHRMSARVCFRYKTGALVGPWRRRVSSAREDAIRAGLIIPSGEAFEWRVKGKIEPSYCDNGGPCGGNYPPEDQ